MNSIFKTHWKIVLSNYVSSAKKKLQYIYEGINSIPYKLQIKSLFIRKGHV